MSRAARRMAVVIPLALAAVAGAIVLADGEERRDEGNATAARGWTALPSSPLERTEVGAARVGRFIYVVGGALAPDFRTTAQVARYDIRSGSWAVVTPMPLAVNHPAVTAGSGRCRGDVYVYGGYTGEGKEVDALQRYEPARDAWSTLPSSGRPRGAATLAAVGCSLYAIGGATGGSAQRLVQRYDIRRGVWRAAPSMRIAREHLASVAIGRRILALGGRTGGGNLAAVEELDLRTSRWRPQPPVPTARSGFGAAAVRGWAVAVGGEELTPGGETVRPVQALDPRSGHWRKLPGMRTPRHGLGVVAYGGRIFALEGGPRPGANYSAVAEMLPLPLRLLPRRSRFLETPPG